MHNLSQYNSNLGGKADLLWTNPSPANDFKPQTISLNLSNYNAVIIEFMARYDSQIIKTRVIAFVGESDMTAGYLLVGSRLHGRNFSVSNTGITFDYAYYMSNSSTNVVNVVIPYKIYGISLTL